MGTVIMVCILIKTGNLGVSYPKRGQDHYKKTLNPRTLQTRLKQHYFNKYYIG